MDSKQLYKNIFNDWQQAFPVLSKYTDRTLYMIAGPFIMGIRFSKRWYGGDEYILEFEIIPLWQKDTSYHNLPLPLYIGNIASNRGRNQSIEYRRHDLVFQEALLAAKSKVDRIIKPEISLEDLMNFADMFVKDISKYNNVCWIDFFRYKLGLIIFFNRLDILDNISAKIETKLKKWDKMDFKYGGKLSVEEWRMQIYEGLDNRGKFMENVEWNYQRPKIAKLNTARIIGIDDYTPKLTIREQFNENFNQIISQIKNIF